MPPTTGGLPILSKLPGAVAFPGDATQQEPDYSPLMGTLNDLIARGKMLPEAAALVTRKLWAPVVNHPVTQVRMAAMNQAALRAIQPQSQPQAMQQPAPMPAGPNLYNGIDLYR